MEAAKGASSSCMLAFRTRSAKCSAVRREVCASAAVDALPGSLTCCAAATNTSSDAAGSHKSRKISLGESRKILDACVAHCATVNWDGWLRALVLKLRKIETGG